METEVSIPSASFKIRLYLTSSLLTSVMNSMEIANKNVCRLLLRSLDQVEENDLEVNNYRVILKFRIMCQL